MQSLLAEIKRRKVFQVAVVYAVVAWLLIQIVATVEAPLQLPGWFDTSVIVLLFVGFPIAVILAWIYDFSAHGIERTPDAESSKPADPPPSDVAAVANATDSAPTTLENSIAVLPFENMSPDPDHAYFAAGIHEEILNSLAQLKSLNVIARTSVLQYAGTQQPIADIARALGVKTIMEGSVRYAGTRVRVTTQLIDAATGSHLWSEAYEREFDDIFAIQADIAFQVADKLQAEFTGEERQRVAAPASTSTDAYALYLQALNVSATGNTSEIIALLDRAIELDPHFSMALGNKAATLGVDLINTTASVARDIDELAPQIRKFAFAALEIDPQDSNANSALAFLAEFTWHWTEARTYALRALESPQIGGILAATICWSLSWAGDPERGIEGARRIQRLSPADWSSYWNLGITLNYAGRYDEAAVALRASIDMIPAIPLHHSWLAITEVARGESASARGELELTEKLLGEQRPTIYLLDMGYTWGRLGDTDNARRLIDEALDRAEEQAIGAGGFALGHLAVGEPEKALQYLREAAQKAARHEVDAGMFSLMNLRMNYTADPLLETAEFAEVRAQLKGD
ncbi:MAG: hypothetical protein PVF63_03360 [Gammaproteobacteria bacterium]|jgi:TolB-like protein/Flp pilus assembly protein TadD